MAADSETSIKIYLQEISGTPLLTQAFAQTRHPAKILSLFEPHSVVIRKSKAHKLNEFGRLVRIDEVENGLVSNRKKEGSASLGNST